jgi:hypothetical protein
MCLSWNNTYIYFYFMYPLRCLRVPQVEYHWIMVMIVVQMKVFGPMTEMPNRKMVKIDRDLNRDLPPTEESCPPTPPRSSEQACCCQSNHTNNYGNNYFNFYCEYLYAFYMDVKQKCHELISLHIIKYQKYINMFISWWGLNLSSYGLNIFVWRSVLLKVQHMDRRLPTAFPLCDQFIL